MSADGKQAVDVGEARRLLHDCNQEIFLLNGHYALMQQECAADGAVARRLAESAARLEALSAKIRELRELIG